MPFRRAYPNLPQADALETLISNRVLKGADKAAIDAQIWAEFGETWAVMFTDLSGFSRGVEAFGIIHFLQIIHESYQLFLPCIDRHHGTLLKTEGDSLLVIFPRADDALAAAVAMQAATVSYNKNILPEEQVLLCVGLGFGPMLKIGDVDIYGAQVNAASKLGEDTAQSGEILCTGEFKVEVESEAPTTVGFTSIGAVMNMKTDSYRISY
jgi:adenylate cyclase